MSRENVELVRGVFAAVNRGDLDAGFEAFAPEAEIDMSRAIGLNRGVYSRDQFRGIIEEFTGSWESVLYAADEFIEAGENVVTRFTNRLQGRDGIEVQARGAFVWTIRDGAVVRVTLYQQRQEAVEAAGLSE